MKIIILSIALIISPFSIFGLDTTIDIFQLEESYTEQVQHIVNDFYDNSRETFINVSILLTDDQKSIQQIRITVLINGRWDFVFDDKGDFIINENGLRERVYTPVDDDELHKIKELIINHEYLSIRNKDRVFVDEIEFNVGRKHVDEDRKSMRKKQTLMAIISGGIALVFLIFFSLLFAILKLIVKYVKRKKNG